VHEIARPDREDEIARRIGSRPPALRANGAVTLVAVAGDAVRDTGPGREPGQSGYDDKVVGGVRDQRQLAVGVACAPCHGDRPRRIRLDPDQRARVVGVTMHDYELRGGGHRRREQQRGPGRSNGQTRGTSRWQHGGGHFGWKRRGGAMTLRD
jgi:hypothetical protein